MEMFRNIDRTVIVFQRNVCIKEIETLIFLQKFSQRKGPFWGPESPHFMKIGVFSTPKVSEKGVFFKG